MKYIPADYLFKKLDSLAEDFINQYGEWDRGYTAAIEAMRIQIDGYTPQQPEQEKSSFEKKIDEYIQEQPPEEWKPTYLKGQVFNVMEPKQGQNIKLLIEAIDNNTAGIQLAFDKIKELEKIITDLEDANKIRADEYDTCADALEAHRIKIQELEKKINDMEGDMK